jgi:methyltransferase (TIGR00027 family)
MNFMGENILRADKPGWSAHWVAVLRAAHQLLDEQIIFNDSLALSILGPHAKASIRHDPIQYDDPLSRSLRTGLVIRSRLAEDELNRSVQAGVKQYVVLGAGLNTFSFRNNHLEKGLHVYEVDHSSVQNWKRNILQEAGIDVPDSMTFVAIDLEKDSLADELQKAGFRIDQPAYFSWLGATVYLPKETIFETLKFVASLPKKSGITFDYRVLPSIFNPIEYALGKYIGKLIAEHGEPWKTSFYPTLLQIKLRRIGFQFIESHNPDELNSLYLAKHKDDLRTRIGFNLIGAKT